MRGALSSGLRDIGHADLRRPAPVVSYFHRYRLTRGVLIALCMGDMFRPSAARALDLNRLPARPDIARTYRTRVLAYVSERGEGYQGRLLEVGVCSALRPVYVYPPRPSRPAPPPTGRGYSRYVHILMSWSSPADAKTPGCLGFHRTEFTSPGGGGSGVGGVTGGGVLSNRVQIA